MEMKHTSYRRRGRDGTPKHKKPRPPKKDAAIKALQAERRKERQRKLALGIDNRRVAATQGPAVLPPVLVLEDAEKLAAKEAKRERRRRVHRQQKAAKIAREKEKLRLLEKADPQRQLIDELDRRRRLLWTKLRQVCKCEGECCTTIDGAWQKFRLPRAKSDPRGIRNTLDPERLELRSKLRRAAAARAEREAAAADSKRETGETGEAKRASAEAEAKAEDPAIVARRKARQHRKARSARLDAVQSLSKMHHAKRTHTTGHNAVPTTLPAISASLTSTPDGDGPPLPELAEFFYYCENLEHSQWGNPNVVAPATYGVEVTITDTLLAAWRPGFEARFAATLSGGSFGGIAAAPRAGGGGSAFARVVSAEEGASSSVEHFFATQHERAKANEAASTIITIEQRTRDLEAAAAAEDGEGADDGYARRMHDPARVSPVFHGAFHMAHIAARGYDCDVCGETYTAGCPACGTPNDPTRVMQSDAIKQFRMLGTSRPLMVHVRAVPLSRGCMAANPRETTRALEEGLDVDLVPKLEHTTVAVFDTITLEELYLQVEMNISPALAAERRQLFLPSMMGMIHLDNTIQRSTKTFTAVSPGHFTLRDLNLYTPISAEDEPVHIVLLLAPCRHPYATVGRALRSFLVTNTSLRGKTWDPAHAEKCSKIFWNGDMLPTMRKYSFTRGDQLQLELLHILNVSPHARVTDLLPFVDPTLMKH